MLANRIIQSAAAGTKKNDNYLFENGDNYIFQDGSNYVFDGTSHIYTLQNSTVMRLDGAKEGNITRDGGNKVSDWVDSYVTSYKVSQTTSTAKPEYVPASNNILFDGTSDYLEVVYNLPPVLKSWTSARTIIFSVNTPSAPEGYIFENGATSSTYRDDSIYFNSSSRIVFFGQHSPGPTITLTGSVVGSGTHTIAVRIDSSANNRAVELFLNNVSQGSASSLGASTINPNQLMIGASPDGGGYNNPGNFYNGSINEFIVLDIFATDDQLSEVHDYLTTKWNG